MVHSDSSFAEESAITVGEMGDGVLGVGSGDVYVGGRKWERLDGGGVEGERDKSERKLVEEGTRVESALVLSCQNL